MKAMVFAAGFGTRLGEITQHTPKALVIVRNKPIIQHVLERLKLSGVQSVVINLHHLGDQIRDFLKANSSFGLEIEFSIEPDILGTGGGLLNAARYFQAEKNFIVHNCDVYSEIDLTGLIKAQAKSSTLATLAVMSRETDRALLFNSASQLIGWQNKKDQTGEILIQTSNPISMGFSGIHVCSPKIFDFMRHEIGQFSITRAWFNAIKAGEIIRAYDVGKSMWVDVGTAESLAKLNSP